MATNYPINPRVRALGKARIDIARRAGSAQEWQSLWKRPAHPFPFTWGERWKQCIEYKVDDFAAEVGFYIDILGLPVNAFDPDYAMFTSPEGDFYFSVVPAGDSPSTPADAIRLQFMLGELISVCADLEERGIQLEHAPQPIQPGSALHIASFRSPHGISIELWGLVEEEAIPTPLVSSEQDDEDVFLPVTEADEPDPTSAQPRPSSHSPSQLETNEEDEYDDTDDDEDDDEDNIEYVDIDTA